MTTRKSTRIQEQDEIIKLEKKFSRYLEEVKITSDYLKHIATLDTGSILIVATFSQRFIDSGGGNSVIISTSLFLISLVAVAAAQTVMVARVSRSVENILDIPNWTHKTRHLYFLLTAYIGFLLGIGTLVSLITDSF